MSDDESIGALKNLRYQIEYWGLKLAAAFVQCLPFRALAKLGRIMGLVVFYCDKRGRAVAEANLKAAFGNQYTPEERRKIARASYQTFARTMLELFWSRNLRRERLSEIVTTEGLDAHPCHRDDHSAGIYFAVHASNFEWLSMLGAWLIQPTPVITQRLHNPKIGPIFDQLRTSTGQTVIPQEGALIRLMKTLKSGRKVCFLSDLNIDPKEGGVIIDAFGLKVCATPTPAALARRTGAFLFPAICLPQPDGRYVMRFGAPIPHGPEDTLAEITQRCWKAMEAMIREHPELWLWSYKHWRYKPSKGGDCYPFYANPAKRFDQLLADPEKRGDL